MCWNAIRTGTMVTLCDPETQPGQPLALEAKASI